MDNRLSRRLVVLVGLIIILGVTLILSFSFKSVVAPKPDTAPVKVYESPIIPPESHARLKEYYVSVTQPEKVATSTPSPLSGSTVTLEDPLRATSSPASMEDNGDLEGILP